MSNQQGLITFTLNKNGLKNGTHKTSPYFKTSNLFAYIYNYTFSFFPYG
jgi:hypothetical protein